MRGIDEGKRNKCGERQINRPVNFRRKGSPKEKVVRSNGSQKYRKIGVKPL